MADTRPPSRVGARERQVCSQVENTSLSGGDSRSHHGCCLPRTWAQESSFSHFSRKARNHIFRCSLLMFKYRSLKSHCAKQGAGRLNTVILCQWPRSHLSLRPPSVFPLFPELRVTEASHKPWTWCGRGVTCQDQ